MDEKPVNVELYRYACPVCMAPQFEFVVITGGDGQKYVLMPTAALLQQIALAEAHVIDAHSLGIKDERRADTGETRAEFLERIRRSENN